MNQLSYTCTLFALLGLFWTPAAAQQVLVDDPTSVPVGAAQLEAWHSTEASSAAPAVRVIPALEVAAGVSFSSVNATKRRAVSYSTEGKVLLRPGSAHRVGLAAVGGAEMQEIRVPNGRPSTLYGYGIVSQEVVPDRLTLYQNVGWTHTENGIHELTWGGRFDWAFHDRFVFIGEIAGTGRADPSAQALLRTVLLPNRIEMDVSATRGGPTDNRTTWGTIGLTFMSTPLY